MVQTSPSCLIGRPAEIEGLGLRLFDLVALDRHVLFGLGVHLLVERLVLLELPDEQRFIAGLLGRFIRGFVAWFVGGFICGGFVRGGFIRGFVRSGLVSGFRGGFVGGFILSQRERGQAEDDEESSQRTPLQHGKTSSNNAIEAREERGTLTRIYLF